MSIFRLDHEYTTCIYLCSNLSTGCFCLLMNTKYDQRMNSPGLWFQSHLVLLSHRSALSVSYCFIDQHFTSELGATHPHLPINVRCCFCFSVRHASVIHWLFLVFADLSQSVADGGTVNWKHNHHQCLTPNDVALSDLSIDITT